MNEFIILLLVGEIVIDGCFWLRLQSARDGGDLHALCGGVCS